MGTQKINPEDLDGKKKEEGKCLYAEAGKTVLGNTTFHSLPWLAENVSTIIKVSIYLGKRSEGVENCYDWTQKHFNTNVSQVNKFTVGNNLKPDNI